MYPARSRFLTGAFAASIALGSLVTATPALAAPTAHCVESHAAKVQRKVVAATMKTESMVFTKTLQLARTAVTAKQQDQSAVAADPASTASDRGIAAADVALARQLVVAAGATRRPLAIDRAKLTLCGMRAMKTLGKHATVREARFGVAVLTVLRTHERSLVTWDAVTRDTYKGVDAGQYATWSTQVQDEQAVVATLTKQIAVLKKQLR